MFKFILVVIVVVSVTVQRFVTATPGDFTDAAETVDVPPEHRAVAPAPPQQPYPAQPPYQPRAIFPVAAVPGAGPQYPLFFTTPNGFVPFGSIYSAYQPQQAIVQRPTFFLPQNQPLVSPIAAAAL